MSTWTKVLIGFGVASAVAVAAVVATNKVEQKKVLENGEETEKKETVIDKIKEAAYKKAVKILAWVMINQDKIAAVGAVMALVAGVFQVIEAIHGIRVGKKLHNKVDILLRHTQAFEGCWDTHIDMNIDRYNSIMEALKNITENMPVKKVKL